MGTNYYLHEKVCEHCGRSDERLHIGKSSAGWCFSLHVIPEENLESLEEWVARLSKPGCKIVDECGEAVTPEEMLDTITNRHWSAASGWTAKHYSDNYAIPGPNNLIRHAIGPYCVGHGSGTWDLIPGEFS